MTDMPVARDMDPIVELIPCPQEPKTEKLEIKEQTISVLVEIVPQPIVKPR